MTGYDLPEIFTAGFTYGKAAVSKAGDHGASLFFQRIE
jgi:hypothetical protein